MKMAAWLGLAAASLVAVAGSIAYLQGFIPNTDPHFRKVAQMNAASLLIDPSSAQFRNLKFGLAAYGSAKGKRILCGEINGRNGNGAYAGFSRFAAAFAEGFAVIEPAWERTPEEARRVYSECEQNFKLARSNPYMIPTAKAFCAQAQEAAEEQAEFEKFQTWWQKSCQNKTK